MALGLEYFCHNYGIIGYTIRISLSPDPLAIGDRRPMKNVATLTNGSGVKLKWLASSMQL